jgi:Ras-related GTP-binding protein C/D
MISPISTNIHSDDAAKNQNLSSRPRILLTGLRRSGKTSIQRVIFTKMQPSQTQFLESTPRLTASQFTCGSFINFQVQELPGQLHVFCSSNSPSQTSDTSRTGLLSHDDGSYLAGGGYDMERLLKGCHAVVYVIDAQDDYTESLIRLNMIIQIGRTVNPKIRYEVFIHKVDQLSEEGKIETQRDIHNQVEHQPLFIVISSIEHEQHTSIVLYART